MRLDHERWDDRDDKNLAKQLEEQAQKDKLAQEAQKKKEKEKEHTERQ